MTMHILIIGSGALGGFFGSLLTEAGYHVILLEKREDVVHLIEREGIRITFPDESERVIKVSIASHMPAGLKADLVFIAVKSYDTERAVKSAEPFIGPKTFVMTIQNGLGNVEKLAEVVSSPDRIISGTIAHSVLPLSPNHLKYIKGIGDLNIGVLSGRTPEGLEQIVEAFRKCGFNPTVYPNIMEVVWNKLLINAVINAISTITRFDVVEMTEHQSIKELMERVWEEGKKVCQAKGIALFQQEPSFIFEGLKAIAKAHQTTKPSMLQDLEMGRKTEIDYINGALVREGRALGIDTPYNEALVLLVKAIEEKTLREKAG